MQLVQKESLVAWIILFDIERGAGCVENLRKLQQKYFILAFIAGLQVLELDIFMQRGIMQHLIY
jgi:hypothetical protein